jgi:hypothetical protein
MGKFMPMEDVEFKVGETYENMKGPFEVLDIHGETMEIRWENGETTWTPIDLQQRILERLERERTQALEKKLQKKTKARRGAASTKGFDGFTEADFSKKVAGSSWRSQKALGGAVSGQIDGGSYRFNSWAVSRIPMVHWADVAHRGADDIQFQAKFFAQVDEERLYYGFYIERSDKEDDPRKDWNGFLLSLKDPNRESWLREVASANALSLYDPKKKGAFEGRIHPSENGWRLVNGSEETEIPSLADFLEQLPDGKWLDLQICKQVDKAEVIEKGEQIAEDIARLFEILMPLYQSSLAHREMN